MPLNHTSRFSDLTEAQYLAIGKYVVEWSNVEHLLGVLLGRLIGTPEFLARTYTDLMRAATIQEAILEALELHASRYGHRLLSKETVAEITRANTEVTALRAARNKIAHFCWMRSSDDELFGTRFGGGVPTPKKERRNHMVLKLSELASLHKKTYALVEQISAVVAAIPDMSEEQHLTIHSSRTPQVASA